MYPHDNATKVPALNTLSKIIAFVSPFHFNKMFTIICAIQKFPPFIDNIISIVYIPLKSFMKCLNFVNVFLFIFLLK